ncbi:MAG: hypothetical protein SPI34_02720 [Opitutales bacterium]|nr:hypothetical protein [Opitutales bacterium]
MFFRKRKKVYYVKKDLPFDLTNPLERRKSIRQTKFTRSDIPGNTSRSLKIIIWLAVLLALIWFARECFLSINIFQ